MNILSHYVLSLIAKEPGIDGAEIRRRLRSKITARKVNLSLQFLVQDGKITATSQPAVDGKRRASKFYPRENKNVAA